MISTLLALVATSLLVIPAVAHAVPAPKPRVVEVDALTGVLEDAAFSNTCSNGSNAGATSVFEGKISGGLGKVQVTVSSSWDWSAYDDVDHPAALVSIAPKTLEQVLTCTPFDTFATVTITALHAGQLKPARGEIVAEITGGSVYEVVTPPDSRVTAADQPGGVCPLFGLPSDGTINESIFNFEADPSEPDTPRGSISGTRFSNRAGRIEGTLKTRFNSCTGDSQTFLTTYIVRP